METQYFYFALMPTVAGDTIFYSNVFSITYDKNDGPGQQQNDYETQFRYANGDPGDYNAQWSPGNDDEASAIAARKAEIDALNNDGQNVIAKNWP